MILTYSQVLLFQKNNSKCQDSVFLPQSIFIFTEQVNSSANFSMLYKYKPSQLQSMKTRTVGWASYAETQTEHQKFLIRDNDVSSIAREAFLKIALQEHKHSPEIILLGKTVHIGSYDHSTRDVNQYKRTRQFTALPATKNTFLKNIYHWLLFKTSKELMKFVKGNAFTTKRQSNNIYLFLQYI